MSSYYGVKKEKDGTGYRGCVYHFNTTGNKEISQYLGPVREVKAQAVDDAAEWLEDNDADARPDGSW